MSGLSVNEILDLSILMVAQDAEPRAIDLPGRLSAISGGWFTPCGDVVAGRVAALEEAGFLRATPCGSRRPGRRLRTTAEGLDYVRELGRKTPPRPCAAAVLWHRLRLALSDAIPEDARSATLLELAERDLVAAGA